MLILVFKAINIGKTLPFHFKVYRIDSSVNLPQKIVNQINSEMKNSNLKYLSIAKNFSEILGLFKRSFA